MSTNIEKPGGIKRHLVYFYLISAIGLAIIGYGLLQIPNIEDVFVFLLFLGLGVFTQIAATTATIKSKTSITYAISPAISLATVPVFGPEAAVLIEITTSVALWLIKPADRVNWKKSWRQLVFNSSMSVISIFLAATVFLWLFNAFGAENAFIVVLIWLFAAAVNDQVNLWLLAIMLRLQYGSEFNVFSMVRENAWAIPMDIVTVGLGGGFLAYSYSQFGWIGIVIFFLPLFLSAYAIRLYVSQMQAHMNNLENIIAERTDELKNVMREKDAFLAVLTHDMKSPLTTIGIYAGLLREKPTLLIERPHITDRLSSSQETLLNIVNNILDLEKMQSGESISLDKEAFDLVLLVEEVTEIIRAQANEKNISLAFQAETDPLPIMADRSQIERVLQNLLSNAIKYTPRDKSIFVKVRNEDDDAIVDVIDTGYGIPADELAYIFERFRRVSKHKKNAPGTGLGLAITKALVEAHGGEITVQSEEDKGSQFTFSLPRQQ